jgi:hypothetical protein
MNLRKLPGSVVQLIAQNKQNIFACMKNMRIDKEIEKLPRGEK